MAANAAITIAAVLQEGRGVTVSATSEPARFPGSDSCKGKNDSPTTNVLKATLLLLGGNLLGSSINARWTLKYR